MSTELEDYMAQLNKITALKDATTKGSIRWYIDWYDKHYPLARMKYRFAGIAVLVVALYAVYDAKASWISVGTVAATGAFLVALNAFFAWGTAWRVYFHAKVRLEFLLQAYEARLIEARRQPDSTKAIAIVSASFSDLLQKSGEAIADEAKGYFDNLKFPSLKDVKG